MHTSHGLVRASALPVAKYLGDSNRSSDNYQLSRRKVSSVKHYCHITSSQSHMFMDTKYSPALLNFTPKWKVVIDKGSYTMARIFIGLLCENTCSYCTLAHKSSGV